MQHQRYILEYITQDLNNIAYLKNGITALYDELYNEYSPVNIKNEKDDIL